MNLQAQPAKLLAYFLTSPGELLTRQELYDLLWPGGHAECDLGLNAAVRAIRASLGDDAHDPKYIETLRGRGYRFVCEVRDVEPSIKARVTPSVRRRTAMALAVTILTAAVGLWVVSSSGMDRPEGSTQEPAEVVQLRYLLQTSARRGLVRGLEVIADLPPYRAQQPDVVALKGSIHYALSQLGQAERYSREALRLDPRNSDALRTVGQLNLRRWAVTAAVDTLGLAAQHHPTGMNYRAYAKGLAAAGDISRAMSALQEGMRLDPVEANLSYDAAFVAYLARDFGTAKRLCRDFEVLRGDAINALRCHFMVELTSGQPQEIASRARQLISKMERGRDAELNLPVDEHDPVTAFWLLELRADSPWYLVPGRKAFSDARALAQLGRLDEALERLEAAEASRAENLLYAAHLPYLDPLRQEQRFKALLARVASAGRGTRGGQVEE